MSNLALRDDAVEILSAIADNIDSEQTPSEQYAKSRGAGLQDAFESAASTHGSLRHWSGFTYLQLTAEYRALRATVLRLWLPGNAAGSEEVTEDVIRFSEAIDQALAESVVAYSEQMARTRDLFLAILGHDLRAPLATMVSAGELLKRRDLSEDQHLDIGAMVDRSARMMGEIIKDLLEFARTQLGSSIPINPEEGDLRNVCDTALEGARAVYPGCPFHLHAEDDLTGSFDSVRLHQLVTNLLLNAAQYRSEGSAVVMSAQSHADTLSIQVQNFGAVIPEESLQAIFDPLVQLARRSDSAARPKTSLGLGLFVAREIATAHGGTITAASSEAEGTRFTVRLPRMAPRRAESA
ncbi:sensor histidine kinase [Noviherbaspirillum pedocola]|nr:HAMP domain-containing sensor histidine kinase [Noviherbaspirillum pedocola]